MENEERKKPEITWGEDTEGMRPGIDGRIPEGVILIDDNKMVRYDSIECDTL